MLDIIHYLDGVVCPDDLERIVKLEKVFTLVGYTDHEAHILNAFGNENLNDGEKGQEIVSIYTTQIEYLLLLMGVYLVDDEDIVNFHFKAHLLENLFMSERIDNVDVLSQVSQDHADSEPMDFLCALLAGLTNKEEGYYLYRIAAVDGALTNKLKALSSVPEAYENIREEREALKKEFLSFNVNNQGPIYRLIVEKGTLPLEYPVVVNELHQCFTAYSDTLLAREIYAGLIASGIEKGARYGVGTALIEELASGTHRDYSLPQAFEEVYKGLGVNYE